MIPLSKEKQEEWNKNIKEAKKRLEKEMPEFIQRERTQNLKIAELSNTIFLD